MARVNRPQPGARVSHASKAAASSGVTCSACAYRKHGRLGLKALVRDGVVPPDYSGYLFGRLGGEPDGVTPPGVAIFMYSNGQNISALPIPLGMLSNLLGDIEGFAGEFIADLVGEVPGPELDDEDYEEDEDGFLLAPPHLGPNEEDDSE